MLLSILLQSSALSPLGIRTWVTESRSWAFPPSSLSQAWQPPVRPARPAYGSDALPAATEVPRDCVTQWDGSAGAEACVVRAGRRPRAASRLYDPSGPVLDIRGQSHQTTPGGWRFRQPPLWAGSAVGVPHLERDSPAMAFWTHRSEPLAGKNRKPPGHDQAPVRPCRDLQLQVSGRSCCVHRPRRIFTRLSILPHGAGTVGNSEDLPESSQPRKGQMVSSNPLD